MIVIPKNKSEEFRVSLDEFHGVMLVNVRVWYRAGDGEMWPGKQGVAIRKELAGQLIAAIREVAG